MISINYRDPTPIYGQVKEGFIRLIITGALKTDEQLPSVRELAAQLSINPNTIQSAYRELENEGYIRGASRAAEAFRRVFGEADLPRRHAGGAYGKT